MVKGIQPALRKALQKVRADLKERPNSPRAKQRLSELEAKYAYQRRNYYAKRDKKAAASDGLQASTEPTKTSEKPADAQSEGLQEDSTVSQAQLAEKEAQGKAQAEENPSWKAYEERFRSLEAQLQKLQG